MEELTQLRTRLDQLTEVGRSLARLRDSERLLEQLLQAAIRLANSDGGTLYRLSKDEAALEFHVAINKSLNLHVGGSSGKQVNLPPLMLYDAQGQPNLKSAAAFSAIKKQSIVIRDAYDAQETAGFDLTGARAFDAANGYHTKSLLVIPLLNFEHDLMGVLQLINATDASGNLVSFSSEDQLIVEAVAAQAGIALENELLLAQMEALFLGFIELLNSAIDAKSQHTSGHCRRVPEITMMLADAAHIHDEGALADFQMSPRDRRELHFAGLLHDCGKVTTPVHVMDKSTKLQTLFDRVALVDTRFEILLRDARIEMLQAMVDGKDAAQARARFEATCARIEEDRNFVARANIGGESMRAEDIARVLQLAELRYEHRGVTRHFLDDDERDNLCIRYGTLTEAERTIINDHIVLTIKMLRSLPWPRDLRNVPEYAGGHHERMDGKGYPNKLLGSQMSWQARMMAIADVFEALTASDRPYKPAKKISETMGIMLKMATSGHLDPDLMRVFIAHEVYLDCARKYLAPELIDDIDKVAMLGQLDAYIALRNATQPLNASSAAPAPVLSH